MLFYHSAAQRVHFLLQFCNIDTSFTVVILGNMLLHCSNHVVRMHYEKYTSCREKVEKISCFKQTLQLLISIYCCFRDLVGRRSLKKSKRLLNYWTSHFMLPTRPNY